MIQRVFRFDQFLSEAISLKQARKATETFLSSGGKKRYNEIFKGKDRLYYDLNPGGPKDISEIQKAVEDALTAKGYTLVDYSKGLAKKDGDDKNTFKIQRLLIKWGLDSLKNQMDSDRSRASSTKTNLKVIISRHGIDIAGQSTGRGWTSCKNLKDGANRHYVWTEIEAGGLVAYLINSEDLNIQNPIARSLIGVFTNVKDPNDIVLYPDVSVYGNASPSVSDEFRSFVENWCKETNKIISKGKGIYNLSPSCRLDRVASVEYPEEELTMKDYLKRRGEEYRKAIVYKGTGNVNFKNIVEELNELGREREKEEELRKFLSFVSQNENLERDYLQYLTENPISKIKEDLDKHPKEFMIYLHEVEDLNSLPPDRAKEIKKILGETLTKESEEEKIRDKVTRVIQVINSSFSGHIQEQDKRKKLKILSWIETI